MVKFRIEKDSLGEVKVESEKLWGAQTQRSIQIFQIVVGKFHFQKNFFDLGNFLHVTSTRSHGGRPAGVKDASRGQFHGSRAADH